MGKGSWEEELDRKVEGQNTKITHLLWIIFVSMITAIITTLAATM